MRGENTFIVTIYSTAVAVTGWWDANTGWLLTRFVLREIPSPDLITAIPFKYAKWFTHIGEASFLILGAMLVLEIWRRNQREKAVFTAAMLALAFFFTTAFLKGLMPAEAYAILIQGLELTDFRLWFLIGFYVGIPMLLRGAALGTLRRLTA
ncbi:hypothetical protein [Magnetospirillum aberrantis]|uniref:Uncharacterized protein n=1 Tax=Magnetospirillum aberrantis SpK TaxID=908842 RepID=A0A7C9QSL2_9PROT|nr:hypothetical protein [Magnetospirillum aberrantis]NFV79219.1 hypothetical protein [Magnetospirillum aberrantis SpK]